MKTDLLNTLIQSTADGFTYSLGYANCCEEIKTKAGKPYFNGYVHLSLLLSFNNSFSLRFDKEKSKENYLGKVENFGSPDMKFFADGKEVSFRTFIEEKIRQIIRDEFI